MTLSTGPWWCAPVLASGSMITVPAHSFSAPVRAVVTAAARVMPGVCGVLMSSSSLRTTRTPLVRQSVATLGVFHGLDQGVAEEPGFRRRAPGLCYRPEGGAGSDPATRSQSTRRESAASAADGLLAR